MEPKSIFLRYVKCNEQICMYCCCMYLILFYPVIFIKSPETNGNLNYKTILNTLPITRLLYTIFPSLSLWIILFLTLNKYVLAVFSLSYCSVTTHCTYCSSHILFRTLSNWEFGFPIVVLVFNNSIKISDSIYYLWSLSIIYNSTGVFPYSSPACSL